MVDEQTIKYDSPTVEQEIDVVSTYRLEDEARQVVPKGDFDYMSGASGDEYTLKQNNEA